MSNDNMENINNFLIEKHKEYYTCYKSPIQYSADVCEDCEYDKECYTKFLEWLNK